MDFYEQIFESIQSKYDNGEITLEEANELNDLAYQKYVSEAEKVEVEDDGEITLEEAMDFISNYLTEASAGCSSPSTNVNKKATKLGQKIIKAQKNVENKTQKAATAFAGGKEKKIISTNKARVKAMGKEMKAKDKLQNFGQTKKTSADFNVKKALSGLKPRRIATESVDETVNDSVNELKLQVYEAYESGSITEEEKTTFLECLNLENYE